MGSKYYWSFDDRDEFWSNHDSSIDNCFKEAEAVNKLDHDGYYKGVYIGQIEYFKPCVNADGIMDNIYEEAWEECRELSEMWDYPSNEQLEILEERMNKILYEWMKENDNEPKFGSIKFIKYYPFDEI